MLKGHIALVTGGGSGIGRATCQLFAEEGATVVAADLNEEQARQTVSCLPGTNHLGLRLDVTKKEDVERVMQEIKLKYSSPATIAVNSAGLHLAKSFLDTSEEDFKRLMDVNVKGTMLMTQAVCRELIAANKKGSIVNVSSKAAVSGGPQQALYSATKAAVDCMGKTAAREMARCNIRINSVQPSLTKTPMMDTASPEFLKTCMPKSMLDHPADPKEVAQVILFLASDRSSYVSGSSCEITKALC